MKTYIKLVIKGSPRLLEFGDLRAAKEFELQFLRNNQGNEDSWIDFIVEGRMVYEGMKAERCDGN